MFYYKVSADMNGNEIAESLTTGEKVREINRKVRKNSTLFNSKHSDTFFAVSEISDYNISIAAITKKDPLTEKLAKEFIEALNICETCEISMEETTVRDIADSLDGAICDKRISDIMKPLGLLPILRQGYCDSVDFEEDTLDFDETLCEQDFIKASDKYMSVSGLKKEIKRIYAYKAPDGVQGHPVHYMIESDSAMAKERITDILLKALHANDRVKSKKYCSIKFSRGGGCDRSLYESFYKSCTCGAVIVDYSQGEDSDDGDHASTDVRNIDFICDVMKRYRHSVLTVILLPRSCEKLKKRFIDNLLFCSIVEIKEDLYNNSRSRKYLKYLADKRKIGADKNLYAELDPNALYLTTELSKIFDRWYDKKLKRSVYPQYKDVSSNVEEVRKEKDKGCAYDQLNEMTGLAKAKETVTKALNYYKIQRMYKDFGVSQDKPAMHMVFTGNPGTAKTSVARLFAAIMRENNILSSGHLVELGRAGLVGKFVGWTAQIVKQKFKEANGGVLFIDEAYSLADGDHGSFGEEAINTIVQEMENNRDDLIVIFAGYPDEMKTFLDTNPGLRSRIAFHIDFPDYSTDELCEIARHISASSGVTLSEGAVEKLAVLFEQARTESDFGNGRFVRNVIEQSKMNLASRVITMDADKITKKILTTIEAEDVVIPDIKRSAMQTVRRIGFYA